ncbi:MAG: murein transglycosylase A [Rhizobiales bacterium]|nr:murein transglycosylase A [Hyphomicrobiales bacterium]
MARIVVLGLAAALCIAPFAQSRPAALIPEAQIEPLHWSDLDGWDQDDHAAAFDAFLASCDVILERRKLVSQDRPMEAALVDVCWEAKGLGPALENEARTFFETHFRPARIARLGESEGFLTGYYEPVVDGSRTPTGVYKYPLYRRPKDLITGAAHRPGRKHGGRSAAWRKGKDGKREPYYDRAAIEDGALDGKGLEICWLKSPVDAFFIQIQGSARIRLEDGSVLRVNYDAHNGQPYTPVGRVLIERNLVPREEMSMDRIRQWMESNPEEAKDVRRQNKSFVFFRVKNLSGKDEAIGGQGIPLTPLRSIAVDAKLHAYGTPFWIESELPLEDSGGLQPWLHLMIAQDTGSAIVGPARADIYFGAGDAAGRIAGRIRHPGQFIMLIPQAVDPATSAAALPLPQPRPSP